MAEARGSPSPPAARAGDDGAGNAPWSRAPDAVLRALGADAASGLSPGEVERRRRRHGPNRLRAVRRVSWWEILFRQFASLIVALLAVAAVLALLFGQQLEAAAIAGVIVLNAVLGFVTELRAVRSVEALRELGRAEAKVRRGGRARTVPADELVPGDVVLLEGGDVVSADLRLIESSRLRANESTLTGESVPVEKDPEPVAADAPVADRHSMLFKGTAVTRGSATGVAVATGMRTELGRISELVEEAEEEVTPLERRLEVLGRQLVWVVLVLAAFAAVAGWVRGRDLFLVVETAIALGVSAIPEGLPIVATIAMARGVWRMARRNALVRRLSAVETLGSTSVILTDKTGTLTENRMRADRIVAPGVDGGEPVDVRLKGVGGGGAGEEPADEQLEGAGRGAVDVGRRPGGKVADPRIRELLRVAVLCSNAELVTEEGDAVGDPTEVALLEAGRAAGFERAELLESLPEEREVAFDPETRKMATVHRADGEHLVAVKGAPDAVLAACAERWSGERAEALDDEERDRWVRRSEELAQAGLRVLGFATRTVSDPSADPYRELTFLGLVGLIDPPREGIRPDLEACRRAGIEVVMVTGDHPETARAVAVRLGLVPEDAEVVSGSELVDPAELDEAARKRLRGARVFARGSPEQKLNLLALHQDAGEVVAMTGDGVNDAPALRKADIGVAMGRRGTQVAREAADVVLEDDEFTTIVTAVEQGRVIFGNIRAFVVYLLSCNVSEIMVVALAALAGAPLPVLPLQILFLNLVTDVFPALALGVGEGEEGVLERPPRPRDEPVLERGHWWAISGYAALIAAPVLGSLAVGLGVLGLETPAAVTLSFLTLAFAQLWHVFSMRAPDAGVFRNEVTRNPWVWGAVGLCVALVLLAVYLPGLARVLGVRPPGPAGWGVVVGLSPVPLVLATAIRESGMAGRLESLVAR